MNKFKLVVLDLDYTITDSNNRIHDEDKKAIIKIQKQGVKVVFSTGRTYSKSVSKLAQKLKLPNHGGMAFCLNGGLLIDLKTQQIISHKALKKIDLNLIINQIIDRKVHAIFAGASYNQVFALKNHWTNRWLKYWAKWNIKIIDREQLMNEKITSIFIFPTWRWSNFKFFQDYCLNRDFIAYRFRNVFVQITTTNKGESLVKYLRKNRIKNDEVLIFGDSNNDLELFEIFKYTIAMGNASSLLWKLSYDRTSTYKEAGVSRILNKYILNQAQNEKKYNENDKN